MAGSAQPQHQHSIHASCQLPIIPHDIKVPSLGRKHSWTHLLSNSCNLEGSSLRASRASLHVTIAHSLR